MGLRDMADRTFDPPSVVQACLKCQKPKCTNCVKSIPRSKLRRPQRNKKERTHEKKTND